MTTDTLTRTLPATLAGRPEDYARLGIPEHPPARFEDAMRTDGSPGTYEWWYFDAHLDDGAKLVVVFYTKASGDPSDPLTPKISINLDLADGRKLERVLIARPDEFQASREACDVRIAGNRFSGDLHSYRIQATIDDVTVDVELTGQVPAWRPNTGHWYFGEPDASRLFAWFLSVPQGQVNARYVIDGVTHHTTGIGYHDHNWGDVPMAALVHDWYWARGKAGAYSVVVAYITTEARFGYQPLPILLIAKDGEILTDCDQRKVGFSMDDVHVDVETGKPVANVTRYEYTDDTDRYVVTFTRERTILRNRQIDILSERKRAAAVAAGFDGVYLRFTGEMVFEHFHNGSTVARLTEPAMWELMYFGQPRQTAV
jgi:hypothetical protein